MQTEHHHLRLLVTGSRTWNDPAYIWHVLDQLLAEHPGMTLLHGNCPSGADRYADAWARQRQVEGARIRVNRFHADWNRYSRAAGPRRNAEMVAALGTQPPVACHAFIRDHS